MSCTSHFGTIDELDKSKVYCEFGYYETFQDVLIEYHCIPYDDGNLDLWIKETFDIFTYYNQYGNDGKGLCRYAVTLIPPESVNKFIEITQKYAVSYSEKDKQISGVVTLLKKAFEENKWVIHFGV